MDAGATSGPWEASTQEPLWERSGRRRRGCEQSVLCLLGCACHHCGFEGMLGSQRKELKRWLPSEQLRSFRLVQNRAPEQMRMTPLEALILGSSFSSALFLPLAFLVFFFFLPCAYLFFALCLPLSPSAAESKNARKTRVPLRFLGVGMEGKMEGYQLALRMATERSCTLILRVCKAQPTAQLLEPTRTDRVHTTTFLLRS